MPYRQTPLFRFFICSLLLLFLCLLSANPALRRAEYAPARAGEEAARRFFPPASVRINSLLTHG